METTHGELQQYHNQEVTENPDYRMDGMFDVSRKEMLDHIWSELEDTEAKMLEAQPQWSQNQWDIINQMRAEMKHIHKDLHELQAKKKSIEEGW